MRIAAIGVVVTWLCAPTARAETFDFEDLPKRTKVTAQYGSRGIIFPFGAYIDEDATAHSGTRVLRSADPGTEFNTEPMVMTFTTPQSRVAFHAGLRIMRANRGTLRAFDAAGAVVATDGPRELPLTGYATRFEVRTATPRIVRIEYANENAAFESIDDLVVEGSPPGDVPTAAPVVTIDAPTEGSSPPIGRISIRGTVRGEGLYPQVTVRVARALPSDSTAPPGDNSVVLQGTGSTRTFELSYGIVAGPYTVTVIATNTANQTGTATVHFGSIPDAITARYNADGGAAVFGAMQYSGGETGCIAVVYERGVIALVGTATFVVRGAILDKWRATRDPGAALSRIGCPIAEDRGALGSRRAQDFARGRIYAGAGAQVVPSVFRDAIESLGGEAQVGVPVADATSSIGAMQTWLFQRFDRPGSGVEPSTLEIRGSPPKLYVERIGDDPDVLRRGNIALSSRLATVWREFPCTGNTGPCTVTRPTSAFPSDTGSQRCNGGTYPWSIGSQWPAVSGDHRATKIVGYTRSSGMACGDNPFSHDYYHQQRGCAFFEHFFDHNFASDWNVHIAPIAPYGGLLTRGQAGAAQPDLEIEFELYYAQYFFVGWGWPVAGDLVH
jgi:hypothetical protein